MNNYILFIAIILLIYFVFISVTILNIESYRVSKHNKHRREIEKRKKLKCNKNSI